MTAIIPVNLFFSTDWISNLRNVSELKKGTAKINFGKPNRVMWWCESQRGPNTNIKNLKTIRFHFIEIGLFVSHMPRLLMLLPKWFKEIFDGCFQCHQNVWVEIIWRNIRNSVLKRKELEPQQTVAWFLLSLKIKWSKWITRFFKKKLWFCTWKASKAFLFSIWKLSIL